MQHVVMVTGARAAREAACRAIDPRLARLLRRVLLLGIATVVLLPAARVQGSLGWPPLWLVGMPLSALWALHRFRLPAQLPARLVNGARAARRRRLPQARRRTGSGRASARVVRAA